MSKDFSHYDIIASSFLTAGTMMIAIIASLVPIAKAQNALTERTLLLYGATVILLASVIFLSIFALISKTGLERKRILSVVPALPLICSVILLIFIILE